MFAEAVSFPVAFLAGLISFFSPCVLPLIPAYFSFITGFSMEDLTEGTTFEMRKKVFFSTILFVSGFSLVFILLGSSASLIGGFVSQYIKHIKIIGSLIIIIFGLHLTGWLRIGGLEFEKRVHVEKKPIHFLGAFLVGMAFGAGWTPCIGPLLGSILAIAASKDSVGQGVLLLGTYSAGLAIPFLIISLFINYILVFIKKASKILKYINTAAGILLIGFGIFLLWSSFI